MEQKPKRGTDVLFLVSMLGRTARGKESLEWHLDQTTHLLLWHPVSCRSAHWKYFCLVLAFFYRWPPYADTDQFGAWERPGKREHSVVGLSICSHPQCSSLAELSHSPEVTHLPVVGSGYHCCISTFHEGGGRPGFIQDDKTCFLSTYVTPGHLLL